MIILLLVASHGVLGEFYKSDEISVASPIFLQNEIFIDAMDSVYNYLPHRFIDSNFQSKHIFTVLMSFVVDYLKVAHNDTSQTMTYKQKFDRALTKTYANELTPAHLVAAPILKGIDVLRAATRKRVSAVQEHCTKDIQICEYQLRMADSNAEKLCFGYTRSHVYLHQLCLDLSIDVHTLVEDFIIVSHLEKYPIIRVYLLDNIENMRNVLNKLLDLYKLILTTDFPCLGFKRGFE